MHDFGAAVSRNSLLGRQNSLLGPEKFPVPGRREFARTPLNFLADSNPKVPPEGKKTQIP
jgi:hypothetical protein